MEQRKYLVPFARWSHVIPIAFCAVSVNSLACMGPGSSRERNRTEVRGTASGASEATKAASSAGVTASAKVVESASAGVVEVPRMPLNVLLITIDSVRADMPWAGYPREIAPNLTALSKQAITYTNAYSISSFTSKSLGGLLGGRFPSELSRTGPFFTRYKDENMMFPEVLREQGVHTLAGHAHAYLEKGQSGFEQGFEAWRVVPGITFDYNTDPYITSPKLTSLATEMLSDSKLTAGRFFAWFHYMDPHEKYQSHVESPHWGKKARDIYDEEVFYTDLWIGKLLTFVEQQPWSKQTVIVVTADHGEAFGEHNLYRHAFELYEELVHVPMLIVVPGANPRQIEVPRSHMDLIPTLFDLLGAKPNPELRGKSFVKELFGSDAETRDVICDLPEDSFNERRRSLLHEGWKLIAFGNDARYELYNLKSDPGEKENFIKKDPERAKSMIELYKEASKTIVENPVKGGVQKHKSE